MEDLQLDEPFPCIPLESTETRDVRPIWLSRTKISTTPLVSPGTRLVAMELKAIYRPSPEMDGYSEKLFACVLLEFTETRIVSPAEIDVGVFGGVGVGVCEGVAEAVGAGESVGVKVGVGVGRTACRCTNTSETA